MTQRKNSKRKGKEGELELAHKLQELGFPEARRSQQYSGTESTADVVGAPGLHIECKRVEQLNIYNAIEQAKRDAGESGDKPIVMHRKNAKPWLATMYLDDFVDIYNKKENRGEKKH